jgi:hypothetical protein
MADNSKQVKFRCLSGKTDVYFDEADVSRVQLANGRWMHVAERKGKCARSGEDIRTTSTKTGKELKPLYASIPKAML